MTVEMVSTLPQRSVAQLHNLYKLIIADLIKSWWQWATNQLADDLRDAGIPVLSRRAVRAHMRAELAKERPDLLLKAIGAVWDTLLRHWAIVGFLFLYGVGYLILAAAIGITNTPKAATFAVLMMMPELTWVILFALSLVTNTFSSHDWAVSWLRESVGGGLWVYVPPHLRARIELADESVPGLTFEKETLDDDPLLFACRRRLGVTRRVAIGAWETGTKLDQI